MCVHACVRMSVSVCVCVCVCVRARARTRRRACVCCAYVSYIYCLLDVMFMVDYNIEGSVC